MNLTCKSLERFVTITRNSVKLQFYFANMNHEMLLTPIKIMFFKGYIVKL